MNDAKPEAKRPSGDPEVLAMSRAARLLETLPPTARSRVAQWLYLRFTMD